MHRRDFLRQALGAAFLPYGLAQPADWRGFEISTQVDVRGAAGLTRAWLPLAFPGESGWQRVIRQSWRGNAATMRAIRDAAVGAGVLYVAWPDREPRPQVEVTLRVAVRDREIDWSGPRPRAETGASLRRFLQPMPWVPIPAAQRAAVLRMARAEPDHVAKARAIYEWIVASPSEPPADGANVLFAALARAAGVPARVLPGIRVAPGRVFPGLSASDVVTTAQHCRVEFHSPRHGWVPVDPADVRQVVRAAAGALDSPEVSFARRRLFGWSEGNWVAFNDADEVRLPNRADARAPLFMHPVADTGGRSLDSRDPAAFAYWITAREVEVDGGGP